MIYRIDVRTVLAAREGAVASDPLGEAVRHQIVEFGTRIGPVTTSRIFLIETSASGSQIARAARELLADPIVERAQVLEGQPNDNGHSRIEIHLKPGVMDPVAASTEMALRDMGVDVKEVRTGRAYLIEGKVARAELERIASRVLANGVIESVHFDAYIPRTFETGHEHRFELRHVPIRELSDERLAKLSREGHLFLSLAEMKAIQSYYLQQRREPTDVELETLAQTWSEHCVHKTLKSAVDVEVRDESGKVIDSRHYNNLIKETIFASTEQLMKRAMGDTFCLSVFSDNAGVIAFDETDAVCFKVETHNHPSAIEPYGGSATGVGGVIRDILGTGLAAKPVANTDVFCVAFPDYGGRLRIDGDSVILDRRLIYADLDSALAVELRAELGITDPSQSIAVELEPNGSVAARRQQLRNGTSINFGAVPATTIAHALNRLLKSPSLPRGIIHPKRILQQVVAGVRDYGNRMGIPTVNGAVYFDDRYLGNPLVFCGCVGLIPRDKIDKESRAGDAIVVMGGRTGRDGIHGATFSSAELTDTHANEFSHAVQIGNAITEKKMADVILQARDRHLFTAITDCGAGGLSSAVGEMGEKLGAFVELDKVPLKYAGLRYDEIWISEAQERMVLSVPKEKLQELLTLSASEDVEATVIGHFGTERHELVLNYRGQEVGRLAMDFLHHGIPMPTRKAVVVDRGTGFRPVQSAPQRLKTRATGVRDQLVTMLAHPNVASKHWIIRQYDHEVQGGSVIKPLTGPLQTGPSDAAVVRPKLNSYRGVAIGCGLAPHIEDPYQMAIAAIDEAIRNVVAVGADPGKIAILDNFCWPSVEDEKTMGTLVRACEACRDAALACGIPFISGKDSLHNQFTDSETGQVIRIPNTLLISAIGVLDDVRKCVTMDLKRPGNQLLLIQAGSSDLAALPNVHAIVFEAIREGWGVSCHDVSEGGPLVAAAEMCIASDLGVQLTGGAADEGASQRDFDDRPGQYLVEINENPGDLDRFVQAAVDQGVRVVSYGRVMRDPMLTTRDGMQMPIAELRSAWRGTLDW